ncbi:MAG TPA: TIGR03118 family protein [Thermoanaerobaculia bacterium]
MRRLALVLVAGLLCPLSTFAAAGFVRKDLVATSGTAPVVDPNLINPWGIAMSPTSPFWVANNGSDTATLYSDSGGTVTKNALVVAVPGIPTGDIFNPNLATDFNGDIFIFATLDGKIAGWQGSFGTTAATRVISGIGAIFTGLTIAANPTLNENLLYVADFHNSQITTFAPNYATAALSPGAFTDPTLPAGFAPFNIQLLGGKLYVAYAAATPGPGKGFVDVFNLDGVFQARLISGGALNSPWGLIIAPAGFGTLAGALLVGNHGDGRINAYDLNTGTFLATLSDPASNPITIPGLFTLTVGNGTSGDANAVYFTADATPSVFGKLVFSGPIVLTVSPISATEGAAFNGNVATLTDPNTTTPSSITATINWGDSTTTPGTVASAGGNNFTVSGTHTFAEEGTFAMTVSVSDGTQSASGSANATAADALLNATGVTVNSNPTFNGVVATFTDADPNGVASDFTATINWGDATSSLGIIAALGSGFSVSGTHTFTTAQAFAVSVAIHDAGGASATAPSTITVSALALASVPALSRVALLLLIASLAIAAFVVLKRT